MKIEYLDHLLETSMTIHFKGRSLAIDHLVIDTGAAHTLISSDIAAQIGIHFENGDKLVRSYGIGGDEYSFRKQIDQARLGNFIMDTPFIDFGVFHEDINHINGLVGLDILKHGNMIIDLYQMEMYPAIISQDCNGDAIRSRPHFAPNSLHSYPPILVRPTNPPLTMVWGFKLILILTRSENR